MKSDSARYKRYLLIILPVVLAFNTTDAVVLGLALQDIKTDLQLSDTQLGLLTGIAFALFYSVAGIPIARWADRGNRVAIIAITTALWSVMLALCAAARTFPQLLLIRVGVAVGEAGCTPPALSLIADHFTRAERPRAVARYLLGWPIAVLIGYFAAGWLIQFYGWRITYVLLGVPGLALATMVWFTLREPRLAKPTSASFTTQSVSALGEREAARDSAKGEVSPADLKEVTRSLWANMTLRYVLACWVVMAFFGTGATQFQAAFMIRSYGLQTGEIGTWFAGIYGLSGLLGTYWGGQWASRRAANNEPLQLKAVAVAYSSLGLWSAFIYLSSNRYLAFGLMGLAGLMSNMPSGPLFGTLQTLVPPRRRATTTALLYLFSNLIGTGLGPLAAGALSDALRPLLGEESLRYALLAFCPGYVWCGWFLWRASQTVAHDVKAVQENSDNVTLRSSLGETAVNTPIA